MKELYLMVIHISNIRVQGNAAPDVRHSVDNITNAAANLGHDYKFYTPFETYMDYDLNNFHWKAPKRRNIWCMVISPFFERLKSILEELKLILQNIDLFQNLIDFLVEVVDEILAKSDFGYGRATPRVRKREIF
jgi:hypothetical protein